jgi:hypothetical protein
MSQIRSRVDWFRELQKVAFFGGTHPTNHYNPLGGELNKKGLNYRGGELNKKGFNYRRSRSYMELY